MASFGAAGFTALEDGWSEQATSAVSVRGFPGGDNWAISLGGQREITRTVSCLFADKNAYLTFVLLRGTEAALSIDVWDPSPVDAVLKECNPDPPRADGQVVARASFILV